MMSANQTLDAPRASPAQQQDRPADPVLHPCQATLRRRAEPGRSCHVGPPAAEVIAALDRVVAGRKSEAVLIWPQRPEGIAVFHALASLDRIANCDRERLSTLLFPWSRNTGGTQRTLLVDRDYLVKTIHPALNRVVQENPANPAFGYLMALHSLKHLLSSGKEDRRWRRALESDPGLIHPTLFEVMPQIGIQNDGIKGNNDQFLQRLRRHTWISGRTEHIQAASDPLKTPFFMFGVHADAVRVRLWRNAGLDPRHGGRHPDVILLDLTRRARNRLGGNWRGALSRFLSIAADVYGQQSPPILAITDEAFVLQALRSEILKDHDERRGFSAKSKKPAAARLVLSPKPEPVDPEIIAPGAIAALSVETYGADVLSFVDFGLKLRRSLIDFGEEEIAAAVTAAVDALQNLIGLPGSPRQFIHDFIPDNYEGFEQQSVCTRYDHLAPRGKIKSALNQGFAGQHHKQLAQFLEAYDKLCMHAATDNPGQALFDGCLRQLIRKATRSIIVFSSELLRGFAEWRIETDPALADVRPSLGKKLLLVDRREAVEELEFSQREQKLFQRIVFVEPHADDFLHVLTRPWLPEKVIVLANLARAEQTLRRIKILLELEGVDPVRENLLTVQREFSNALQGRIIDIPDLDAAPPLPRLGTLDLTATGGPGSGPTRIIRTSGDLQIRAFDGSEFALYNPEALQVFSRKLASDLQPGDQICVFSSDFVDSAREKLNLTANASEVLALYHNAVAEAVAKIIGSDIAAKAAIVRERILKIDPSLSSSLPELQAIRHWIDVADLVNAPRDEVRPQAPRERRHYLCFMKAIGIADDVARDYWDWGVFWTRSMRIRTGAAFHQVFMGILIDPHAAAGRLPAARRHEVWRIYETAEHHVVTVHSNEREGGTHESR